MTDDLIERLRALTDENFGELDQFSTWGREMVAAADALEAQARRISELSEAIGLLTTLKPDMEIDANSPVNMAAQIVAYVDARIAELEAALKPFADAGRFTKTYEYSEDTEMAIHFTYANLSKAHKVYYGEK
jgi:hypothetical protein